MNIRALNVSAILVLLLGVLATACIKTGTNKERTPVTRSLASYRTASIYVQAAPDIENGAVYRSQLENSLVEFIKDKNLFSDVPASGGELLLKVTILTLEKPTKIGGLPLGEVDMTGSVDLIDDKTKNTIGAFDITATSKKKVQTKINGVDTSIGEDPRKRAMFAAAEQVATFIEEHRGAAVPTAAPASATPATAAPMPSAPPPPSTPPSAPPPGTGTPNMPPATGTPSAPPPSTAPPATPPPPVASPPIAAAPSGSKGRLVLRAAPLPANVRVAGRSACSLVCVSVSGAAMTDSDKRQIETDLGKHLGAMRGCLAGQPKSATAIVLPFGPTGNGQLEYDFGQRSGASDQCRASLPAVSISGPASSTWKCTDYCD